MRALWMLTLWISLPAYGGNLSELLAKNRQSEVPKFTYSFDILVENQNEVRQTVAELEEFAIGWLPYLFLPENPSLFVSEGGHYIYSAKAQPYINRIILDESVWNHPPLNAQGLLGHEYGHLIFRANMLRLLKREMPELDLVPFAQLARQLRSDLLQLNEIKTELEVAYPSLKSDALSEERMNLSLDVLLRYHAIAGIHAAVSKGKVLEVEEYNGEYLVEAFLIFAMAGVQEVFSDFIGAIYSKDPACMGTILDQPLSKVFRNFVPAPVILIQEVADVLINKADQAAPHLILFQARQQIYRAYYARRHRVIGQDPRYDALVAQDLLETLFSQFLKGFTNLKMSISHKKFTQNLVNELVISTVFELDEKLDKEGFPALSAPEKCSDKVAEFPFTIVREPQPEPESAPQKRRQSY